jgi:hypothetical protein
MTLTVQMSGGFGGSARSQMSDQMLRRLAEEEAHEAHEAAREARERRQRAAAYQERSEQAAFIQARQTGRPAGHTHGEFLAFVSAQMDREDAQEAARRRAAFNRWQLEQSADASADMSALTEREAELQAQAETAETASRADTYRGRTAARQRLADRKRNRREAQRTAEAVVRRGEEI